MVSRRTAWSIALACVVSSFAGCGDGGSGDSRSQPPPNAPDLAGVWAGSWQGADPELGPVTGFWNATLDQNEKGVTGAGYLLGDVDCMGGSVKGSAGETNFTGTLDRSPCRGNSWKLEALSTLDETASGSWTQTGTNARGTFTGTRIAVPGGPRIDFISPPGGGPGTVLTLVGSNFDASAANNSLTFGPGIPAQGWVAASSSVLTVRVPEGVTTAPLRLFTPANRAQSPRPFNADITSPEPIVGGSTAAGSGPARHRVQPGWTQAVRGEPRLGKVAQHGHQPSARAEQHASRYGARRGAGHRGQSGWQARLRGWRQRGCHSPGRRAAPAHHVGVRHGIHRGRWCVARAAGTCAQSRRVASLRGRQSRRRGRTDRDPRDTRTRSSPSFGAGLVPVGVAASPDGNTVYVAVTDPVRSATDFVAVVDPRTGVPGRQPSCSGSVPDRRP